jgi:uncharacterized iron-regulated protein
MDRLAATLAEADVVVLGEEHQSPAVHAAHLRILEALQEIRPDLILSMEMFERDVQTELTHYLARVMDEDEFLASSRPWPRYETDYRPAIQFARDHGICVVAANIPRELANRVAREGDAALEELVGKSALVAAATTAPEDGYWEAFQGAMGGHGEMDEARMRRFYQAQCLKDDTMAESVVTALVDARARGRDPLVVHICGRFHSDHGLGTVARIQQRAPDLQIRVLSVLEGNGSGQMVHSPDSGLADYVVLIPGSSDKGEVVTLDDVTHEVGPHADHVHDADPHAVAEHGENPHQANPHQADPHVAPAPSGGRPGLGFMPEYDAPEEGCLVGQVFPGSAAEKAGLVPGDLIVKIDDMPIVDVRSYAAALDQLEVGQQIKISVRRADTVQVLDGVVGRSMR